MTASVLAPAVQVCTFALGCALIHAFRAHAATVTRLLVGAAVGLGVLVLLAASLAATPDDLDAITVEALG